MDSWCHALSVPPAYICVGQSVRSLEGGPAQVPQRLQPMQVQAQPEMVASFGVPAAISVELLECDLQAQGQECTHPTPALRGLHSCR